MLTHSAVWQRTIGDYESQEAARAQAVGALVEEREKMVLQARLYLCTQFTCFTSTNVPILTQLGAQVRGADESIGNMREHLQVHTLVGLA